PAVARARDRRGLAVFLARQRCGVLAGERVLRHERVRDHQDLVDHGDHLVGGGLGFGADARLALLSVLTASRAAARRRGSSQRIPVVRSLLAFDAPKMARYALAAYLLQFAMIMPFYTLLAERSACNR